MKPIFHILGAGIILWLCGGCDSRPKLKDQDLAKFVIEKKAQAKQLEKLQHSKLPRKGWKVFDAIVADDWNSATNLFLPIANGNWRFAATPNTQPNVFDKMGE